MVNRIGSEVKPRALKSGLLPSPRVLSLNKSLKQLCASISSASGDNTNAKLHHVIIRLKLQNTCKVLENGHDKVFIIIIIMNVPLKSFIMNSIFTTFRLALKNRKCPLFFKLTKKAYIYLLFLLLP